MNPLALLETLGSHPLRSLRGTACLLASTSILLPVVLWLMTQKYWLCWLSLIMITNDEVLLNLLGPEESLHKVVRTQVDMICKTDLKGFTYYHNSDQKKKKNKWKRQKIN